MTFPFALRSVLSCAVLIFATAAMAQTAPAPITPAAQAPAATKAPAKKPAKAVVAPAAAQGGARIPAPGVAERPLFDGRDFEDPRSGMEMRVPSGWVLVEVPKLQPNEISMVLMEGPGSPPPTCRVGVRTPKQPPKVTRAMLNKVMHDDRNVAAIKGNLGKDGRRVVGINKITQDGISGLRAQALVPGTAQRPDLMMVITILEAVGRSYTFECNVLAADYDTQRVDIDSVIKSVRFQKAN